MLGEQLDERVGAGVLAGVGPVDVVPEDVRGEAIDELAQLRGGEGGEGGVVAAQREEVLVRGHRREVGDVPVQRAGVVETEPQPGLARRGRELGDEVPARAARSRSEHPAR